MQRVDFCNHIQRDPLRRTECINGLSHPVGKRRDDHLPPVQLCGRYDRGGGAASVFDQKQPLGEKRDDRQAPNTLGGELNRDVETAVQQKFQQLVRGGLLNAKLNAGEGPPDSMKQGVRQQGST